MNRFIHLSLVILFAFTLHAEVKTVPYFMGFEEGTTDSIKIFDLNGKTGQNGYWKIKQYNGYDTPYYRSGLGALVYFYDSKRSANDWAILDGIEMQPGKYTVKFWYVNYSNPGSPHPERVLLAYGKEALPDSMTTEVVRYDPFDVDAYTESSTDIEITEPGIYYFGFKAFSDKDENLICIDDFSVTEYVEQQEENDTLVRKWDAETGKIEDDIVLHNYDSNTINPDFTTYMSDMLLDNGIWTLIGIQYHITYGEWMYCCPTYFSSSTVAADRWLVLPQMKVTGEDAYFSWNAASFGLPESYNIMISEEGDNRDSYTQAFHIDSENTLTEGTAYHRISLSDYVGKTINVAIQATSIGGSMLLIDNLAFHNSVETPSDTEGIIETTDVENSIAPDANSLSGMHLSTLSGYKGIVIKNGRKVLLK